MGTFKPIAGLDSIPSDVWAELSLAVKLTGMNAELWHAYLQLPVLFAMSPAEVEEYLRAFPREAKSCKV